MILLVALPPIVTVVPPEIGLVTVTVQSLYTELLTEDVALTVAVPVAFAVTRPVELTEATLLPEITLHVTL